MSYPPYIYILKAAYMPQILLAASSSIAQNYFLACSILIPVHLDLEGSTLVSTIGPKQMLLNTRL